MPNSPKNQWPYPKNFEDPFFDKFVAMINAIDASFFTTREDKNFVLFGGGIVSFNATSGELAWTAPLEAISVTSGFHWFSPSPSVGGSVVLQDGEFFYISLVRNPQTSQSCTPVAASVIPPSDDALVIAQRIGNIVVFRNGVAVSSGQSVNLFTTQLTLETRYPGVAGVQPTDEPSFVGVGAIYFDPTSVFGNGVGTKFRAILETTDALLPAECRLYNVTDGEVVAGSTLASPATVATMLTSGALTLPLTPKLYEVQVRMDGVAGPSDQIVCKMAELYFVSPSSLLTVILSQETRYVGLAGLQTTDEPSFVAVGGTYFDPTLLTPSGNGLTRSIKFRAVLETTDAGLPVECQLYNITDGALVGGSLLTSTSLAPAMVTSADLALPATPKLYEVRFRMNGVAGPSDQVACKLAELSVTWA